MACVGYIPFAANGYSIEAKWLEDAFSCQVEVVQHCPTLNLASECELPTMQQVCAVTEKLLQCRSVVAEGPGGFLWAAVLRTRGYLGSVTILPYLNPRSWYDVACISVYRRFIDKRDHIFLGSMPSAEIYRRMGVVTVIGEPYGIDGRVFFKKPTYPDLLDGLGIPSGQILLFAGRAQPDKDLYCLLRVGLRAQLLFPNLQIVIATHVVNEDYLTTLRKATASSNIHWVLFPSPSLLADLYNVADVFVTAATSLFETFGRALAEALACGTPVVAPRYDGFAEILSQPGGVLVDVDVTNDGCRVNEEQLLRAIYDVLSTSNPVPSELISATAINRFDRSKTIQLLSHLVANDSFEARPTAALTHTFPLPRDWNDALRDAECLPSAELLPWFWKIYNDQRLVEHDQEFVTAVRLSLRNCPIRPNGA